MKPNSCRSPKGEMAHIFICCRNCQRSGQMIQIRIKKGKEKSSQRKDRVLRGLWDQNPTKHQAARSGWELSPHRRSGHDPEVSAGLRPLAGLPSTGPLGVTACWASLSLPQLSRTAPRLLAVSEEPGGRGASPPAWLGGRVPRPHLQPCSHPR